MKMSKKDRDHLIALATLTGTEVQKVTVNPKSGQSAFRLQPSKTCNVSGRWSVLIERFQPATLNKLLGHPMEAARLKAHDAEIIAASLYAEGVPLAVEQRRRVTLVITLGKGQRGPDKDAFDKSALDALTRCGAIVDDCDRWCEQTKPSYIYGDEKATRIILKDIPNIESGRKAFRQTNQIK